ncbi:MAG: hypothetical protein HY754_10320 [Nitrospirae bacterium]|nr:hypothetical protein [Nitrospirota bacterium]
MREGKKIIVFLLFLFITLLVYNQNIDAKDIDLSEEAQMCLGCHGKNNIKANFQNNESVAAYVDAEKFKASVHNFLTCSGCHDDFSIDKHPERRFRSKEQFKVVSSLVCQRCHKYEQIIANPPY